MTPLDQNVLSTLNLLTLLFRAQNQNNPKLTPEQQHTLKVTKEHLDSNGIPMSVFINSLNVLSEKGYLLSVAIYEDKFHTEVQDFYGKEYSSIVSQIKGLDLDAVMQTAKEKMADTFEKMKPADYGFDREGFVNSDMNFVDLLSEVKPLYENHTNNDVATVILMPFRSIDRLLKKMNDGISFNDVTDPGLWYGAQNNLLHFEEDIIPTTYNKLSYVHFALQALFSDEEIGEQHYAEIPEFDHSREILKELKSYKDALDGFLDKYPQLKTVFSVHSKYFEVNQDYIEHTH